MIVSQGTSKGWVMTSLVVITTDNVLMTTGYRKCTKVFIAYTSARARINYSTVVLNTILGNKNHSLTKQRLVITDVLIKIELEEI